MFRSSVCNFQLRRQPLFFLADVLWKALCQNVHQNLQESIRYSFIRHLGDGLEWSALVGARVEEAEGQDRAEAAEAGLVLVPQRLSC